jgi:hypothetical protein
LQGLLGGKGLLPVLFQLPYDQAAFRLGEAVTASGPVDADRGPFQPLGPDLLQLGPFGQDLLGGA